MTAKKFTKKLILILLMVLIVSPLVFVNQGLTKVQPYYSGDAVNYQNTLIIATANTGYLEIFKLSGRQLDRILKVKIYNATYNNYEDYSDVKLSVEGGNLYVYAVSKYTLYKYDFSDLTRLTVLSQQKNNYWRWYDRIDAFGANLGLVSKNGVDILNSDLQVINSFDFQPDDRYSLRSNGSDKYFLAINGGKIQVYDRDSRSLYSEIPLNFTSKDLNHKIFFDSQDNTIYAIDDYYAKKFSLEGRLISSFRHLDASGYDMESYTGNPFVYFSNGLGVVKMTKDNFKVDRFAFTTINGGPQGWAMGLKAVNFDSGDKVVVFNASNILVLDKNLNKIDSIQAEEESAPEAKEALFLNYSNNTAASGAVIKLNGGGYLPNENLQISFGEKQARTVTASNSGRFSTDLIVPDLKPQNLDIKVVGVDSGLSYSISFTIR